MGTPRTRSTLTALGLSAVAASLFSGAAQFSVGARGGPGPDGVRAIPTDELIRHLSLARERTPEGPPKFTRADAEFVRRLDANQVTWDQLARACERMQIVRVKPTTAGSDVMVWMGLPLWWKSVRLTLTVPGRPTLECNTSLHPCASDENGDDPRESKQPLGRFPPGHHEVVFDAEFRSIYWQADAREAWRPTITLAFDVAPPAPPSR